MDIRNIAIAAHVDAGKTTLTEQILYTAGTIRKPGNVQAGTTLMDWHDIEKNRGITVFSEQAALEWKGVKINLLDTPGHIDFYSELERALKAVDSVILIISAVDGVQQYTETVLELAKKNHLPILFFLNKIDRDTADPAKIMKDIEKIGENVVPLQQIETAGASLTLRDALSPRQRSYQSGGRKMEGSWNNQFLLEKVIEKLAENDEKLLVKYLEGRPIGQAEITEALGKQLKQNLLQPILAGSATWGAGVEELLDYMVQIMPAPSLAANQHEPTSSNPNLGSKTSGLIYKVRQDEKDGLLAYVRLFCGDLRPRDSIWSGETEQKINQLRIYNGKKYVPADILRAGDIGVLLGLNQVKAGDLLGDKKNAEISGQGNTSDYVLTPVLAVSLQAKAPSAQAALIAACKILCTEDPLLARETDGEELRLTVMGQIQIEVLEELLKSRFGLDVAISEPEVQYFETVTDVSTGFCHYEPKKHYAEVEVELSPLARGEGIQFSSAVSTDDLPLQFQNAIRKAVPEALGHGSLAGRPLRDVQVRLVAGKHHLEHTHGGDFRIATIRAVQQALENNRCILLEPLNAVHILAGQELAGRILSDIIKMHGSYEEPALSNGKVTISGLIPVATSLHYPLELNSLSSGTARLTLRTGGLQECHNTEEVLERLKSCMKDPSPKKDENEDILYNSVSLFRKGRKMLKVTND